MTELLALPAWNTPPRSVDDWAAQLAAQGLSVAIERDGPGAAWLEIGALRLRGYALSEGIKLEAINWELSDPAPAPAMMALETAAAALGWEIHSDEGDDND